MEHETKNELITEGQALVALFMGFKPQKSSLGNTYSHPDLMGVYGGTGMKFKYDTSWDWLMPVVHKILKATEPTGEDGGWSYEYIQLEKTRVGNTIDFVYMKVVEYLKHAQARRR